MALVLCPIGVLQNVYRSVIGLSCILLSQKTNYFLLSPANSNTSKENANLLFNMYSIDDISPFVNVAIQTLLVFIFNKLCGYATLRMYPSLARLSEFPLNYIILVSFTMPVVGHSVILADYKLWRLMLITGMIPAWLLWSLFTIEVFLSFLKIVVPAVRRIPQYVHEMGLDGLIMKVAETADLSLLLRVFFLFRVHYQIMMSKTISESDDVDFEQFLPFFIKLSGEVLVDLCGTILSIMSMASMISVISGIFLNIVYFVIGGRDEEANMQPAVSGFLFVLLALQTGMTSMSHADRLKLLLQNCILLVVANQHFIQGVTSELLIKASTDEVPVKKHVRLMLPYVVFFSFPFVVIARLWGPGYPFRVSWLLAISAFTLELVIKSLTTQIIYCINMIQTHVNYLQENIEDVTFYIKAVSGTLDFLCGVFLFINGAYIFLFESSGLIRLTMMIIHCYMNIYQAALKGLKTLRLRRSAWDRVNKLSAASQEQLDENDDICPICYQEMTEAVVIRCNHVFHKACLKRWLTIQERCPLCHTLLEEISPNAEAANNNQHRDMRNIGNDQVHDNGAGDR